MSRAGMVGVVLLLACGKPGAPAAAREAAPTVVRVPSALRVARALDSVSVSIDPASLGDATVDVEPGAILGVETHAIVFAQGEPPPKERARHGYASGASFDFGTSTWNRATDGLPQSGKTYVAEVDFVLFETDVPPGHMWEPHARGYKALLSRTLRQAEE